MQLLPEDEYMHDVEAASHFNESMYFNVFDPQAGIGGFVRIGNRPNEGYAERTVCVYLPDGRVAFMFGRPEITGNTAFDVEDTRFGVEVPFEKLTVKYDGRVVLLAEPLDMADPKRAFEDNPWTECAIDLTYKGISPMYGGQLVNDDGSPLGEGEGFDFARGHDEQPVAAAGTIRVGDDSWPIEGFGLRDHSWGPRHWQAPWYYRWLTANFGADFGFVVSRVVRRDGSQHIGGMFLTEGRYDHITQAEIDTEWEGDDLYHRRLHIRAKTSRGEWIVEGDVKNLIPLRNRRTTPDGEELTTRISEGLTRWVCDGIEGWGLSEYLDQIVDGRPVGAVED
ncbi:MAG: hypothetical protein IT198_02120 [Acidimicrobiia bacterium]|nr:hypothetical protein [Acidimicrobiia bacterium]